MFVGVSIGIRFELLELTVDLCNAAGCGEKFPVCVRNRRPIRFKQPEQPRDGNEVVAAIAVRAQRTARRRFFFALFTSRIPL